MLRTLAEMEHTALIDRLELHGRLFLQLFADVGRAEEVHRETAEKWCLREAICHLYDEEREDFRARIVHVLDSPHQPMPKIDPQAWFTERRYMEQPLAEVLPKFAAERVASVKWLRGLVDPRWSSFYMHPVVGPITAEFLLANWVAHDHHHIRQVNSMRYAYLKHVCGVGLDYAGRW